MGGERGRTRLIIVGGFLGAGKTTLLLAAAQRLSAQGLRVGLVTNDQGADLVDTSLVTQRRLPVAEVAGGCFCCRFPDLLAALDQLERDVAPDVILAEPVGSCTDLMATVLRPLARYAADRFDLAPLTILVDGQRSAPDPDSPVAYLRQRQLAEAEILALTKVDLLDAAQQTAWEAELDAMHPEAQGALISAATGVGVDAWLELVMNRTSALAQVLEIDYVAYADAEASLAWLNAKAVVQAPQPFAADLLLSRLLQEMAQDFAGQDVPIAHLKAQLLGPEAHLKGSVTEAGQPISWDSWSAGATAKEAQVLINARVETVPRLSEGIARDVLARVCRDLGAEWEVVHFECFRPAAPQPTYRLEVA